MRKTFFLVLVLALFSTTFIFADQMQGNWEFFDSTGTKIPFELNIYSYDDGGSGYYELVNLSNQSIRVSWTIYFNNGKSSSGSKTMSPNEKSTGSCSSCSPSNSGVCNVDLTFFEYR